MRKLTLLTLLLFSSSIFAATINLYATPKGEKAIARITPGDRVVPIFEQKGWVKVGIAKDGKVGWMHKDDLYPKSSSIYINVKKNEKDDKEIITAYRDGKKLSEQESKALYEKLKIQQAKQQQEMRHYLKEMNAMMEWNRRESERLFSHGFFGDDFSTMVPGSVVIQESH